jgi:hypothetical protein
MFFLTTLYVDVKEPGHGWQDDGTTNPLWDQRLIFPPRGWKKWFPNLENWVLGTFLLLAPSDSRGRDRIRTCDPALIKRML